MFQNIKVDIIYYKTGTDFEMEFNLSGCCRMRLLTEKAPDRKILVNQLARAVSRSRIIMIAGALFGEDGVINTAAAAIGRKLSAIDNKQFGIAGDEKIEIIEKAIPLVSSDGIFGGCIIEQGPQTLILLSENKNIRKNIMQNLIHPYVQEVCAAELTDKTPDPEPEEETVDEVTEIIPEEETAAETEGAEETATEEIATELVLDSEEAEEDATSDENNAPVLGDELIISDDGYDISEEDQKLADEMVMEDDDYLDDAIKAEQEAMQRAIDESEDLIFEPEYLNRRKGNRRTMEYAYMGADADAYVTGDEYEEDETEEPDYAPRIVGWGINLPIIIIAVILLLLAIILCYCIFIVPQSEGVTVGQYLKDAYDTLFG